MRCWRLLPQGLPLSGTGRWRAGWWVVVGGFLATILIAGFLVPALGLQPLSGLFALVHLICWTPGLILLLRERAFLKGLSLYGVWAGVITAVILISFVFDVRDAGIYLAHMLGGA